jgi:hypothetical protein
MQMWRVTIFSNRLLGVRVYSRNNDNVVRTVNFVTSKSIVVKNTILLQRNILKYAWTLPDVKTHTHTDHMMMDRS